MADYDFENPTFDPDEPDVDDDVVLSPELPTVGPARPRPGVAMAHPLSQELLQATVNDYYDALASEGLTPALGRDPSKFEITRDGRLRLKAFPDINLINTRTGKPVSLTTVAGRPGGSIIIREELGFADWSRKKQSLPAQAVEVLQPKERALGVMEAQLASGGIELEDFRAAAQSSTEAYRLVESTLTDDNLGEILETMDNPRLNLRELRGLDKALQTTRGELVNNLAKLTGLDEHIALEKQKLDQADDEFSRRRIAERLRNLEDERASRVEAAAANREALRSQVSRVRETIRRLLHEDKTLGERIKTLFREQGITIVSILTAIGMAISTLVLALTGGGGAAAPAPTPAPKPSDKGGLKEWVKKHLQALGRVLANLAGKAAAALPGIIGSVVSWLLSTLGKTATWLAGNLWAMVIAVGTLLLVAAREWLTQSR